MAKTKRIPGTLVKQSGRYYWTVTLPGTEKRKTIALRSRGARFATTDKAVALDLAATLWASLVAESAKASIEPADVRTVADLAAAYQATADVGGWAQNRREISHRACGSFSAMFATRDPADITPADLIAWRTDRCRQGARNKKDPATVKTLGVRTVNRDVRAIVAMFDWAVQVGACPSSVAYGLRCVDALNEKSSLVRPPVERNGVQARDVAGTLRFLTPSLADMVRLQWRLGCRSGELCQLEWQHIDRSGDVWIFKPPKWKGSTRPGASKRPRIIAIGPRSQRILAKYLGVEGAIFSPRQSEAERLAAAEAARKTPLSCGNRRGTNRKPDPIRQLADAWDPDAYGSAVREAARKAVGAKQCGEEWTPHQLRHAVGDRVRDAFDLDDAAAYLGHKDIETTKIYAKVATKRAVEVARRLG